MKLAQKHSPSLALSFALAAGCVQPEPEPEWLPAYEPFDELDPSWTSTRRVLLLADCQLFNVLTNPLPDRNLSSEAVAETAVRPPQLNMFADDVLAFVLADDHGAEVAIHLGDALDIGCEGEMREFVATMHAGGLPWLMAPGNHDCTYFGNYFPIGSTVWEEGCSGAGRTMSKDLLIRWYVAALVTQHGPGFDELAASLGLADEQDRAPEELLERIPARFEFEAPRGHEGLLDAIAWNIDEEKPWRSFVVQRADITGVQEGATSVALLLLDSSQYERPPVLVMNAWVGWPTHFNAGLTGEMLADQLRIVRRWIDAGTRFALACHHPYDDWSAKSRSSLRWLWSEHREELGMLLTAHTHAGFIAYHRVAEHLERVELNIGSTTDWPMEWRGLQVFYRGGAQDPEIYLRSPRYTLAEELRNRPGRFEAGWEIPLGAPDDYRRYKSGTSAVGTFKDYFIGHHWKPPFLGSAHTRARGPSRDTEVLVKDTMLLTHARLVGLFPTDLGVGDVPWPAGCSSDAQVLARVSACVGGEVPFDEKIALLRELEAFEGSRATRDPETGESLDETRTDYKLSQAVWSSRYESSGGRRATAEDELIRWRPIAE